LDFELVYPDLRAPPRQDGSGRYGKKHLGSVVIGAGSSGTNGVHSEDANDELPKRRDELPAGDEEKTLLEAKFVIGDYIDCAILPPLPNGDVAPVPRTTAGILGAGGGGMPRENGFGGRGGRSGGGRGGFDGGVPPGEWRRGDPVPQGEWGRGGGGRGRGRGRGW
jgi:histone deacetylase complex subunit SAP18